MHRREYNKRYFKKYPWAKVYYAIISRCTKGKYKDRGIVNYLTKENVKFLWLRDKAFLLKRPSIDRRNTWGNYTLENCRFIEHRLNSAIKRTNKIDFSIAQKIREELKTGKFQKDIGKKYGISSEFVCQINTNKWYKPELYLTRSPAC